MKLYADNDAIRKLAAWDLLDNSVAAIGVQRADCFVLPTARYSLFVTKSPAAGVRRFGEGPHKRIAEFVSNASDVPGTGDTNDDFLNEIAGVDMGEALLFATASRHNDVYVLTGDKRSIRSIAQTPRCSDLVGRLRRRVLCLEQAVLLTMNVVEFEVVKQRVIANLDVDSAVRAAFGSGELAQRENVVRTLSAYVNELRKETGELLADM